MNMQGKAIHIVGSNKLQNELIASSLGKETAVKCFVVENPAEIKSDHSAGAEQDLLLYDCLGKEVETCMGECAQLVEAQPERYLVCLFNLKRGTGLEESLLAQGVRAFFYMGEPFKNLAKGVLSVLNGELWVSRKIMISLIEKNNYATKKDGKKILSRREVDILSRIVEGASNDEIAAKLCISSHTVKTHIYNIYKKIKVKSRFQAALWAAKHL